MPLTILCSNCKGTLRVADPAAGMQGMCPTCRAVFRVLEGEPLPAAISQGTAPVEAELYLAVVADAEDVPLLKGDDEEDVLDRTLASLRRRNFKQIILRVALPAAGAVLAVVGGFLLWWMLRAPDVDERWLPDDTYQVQSINYNAWRKNTVGGLPSLVGVAKLTPFGAIEAPRFLRLKEDEVARLIRVSAKHCRTYHIIHLSSSSRGEDLAGKAEGSYERIAIGKHALFVKNGGSDAFALPSGKLLLAGHEDDVRKILEREGKARLSSHMRLALGKMEPSAAAAFARVPGPNKTLTGLLYAYGKQELTASSNRYQEVQRYKDMDSAARAKEAARSASGANTLGPFTDAPATITQSGATVTIELSVQLDPLNGLQIR